MFPASVLSLSPCFRVRDAVYAEQVAMKVPGEYSNVVRPMIETVSSGLGRELT